MEDIDGPDVMSESQEKTGQLLRNVNAALSVASALHQKGAGVSQLCANHFGPPSIEVFAWEHRDISEYSVTLTETHVESGIKWHIAYKEGVRVTFWFEGKHHAPEHKHYTTERKG